MATVSVRRESGSPWANAGAPPSAGGVRHTSPALTVTLDQTLKERLREVIESRTVTEATLRRIGEEGAACRLILDARLARHERRLAELSADPISAFADIAAEVRSINELKPDVQELHDLLDELAAHARELRASWLGSR
jgi:hypothetical protein